MIISNTLLLIDTAQQRATVALANGAEVIISAENLVSKDHASWLHEAIDGMLDKTGLTHGDLKGVAVVAGPGSYTGLRVGMAAAKGYCYTLQIPLMTFNTLRVMAESVRLQAEERDALVCPMLDARRSEVFTALYNTHMKEIIEPQALILDKSSFEKELNSKTIVFFGDGAGKWEKICPSNHAQFIQQPPVLHYLAQLAGESFVSGRFADPVYAEPVYLKEFFTY